MTTTTKNVHQRKLAVMAKCSAIVPDKIHPHHKFQYVSVQTVSNHLRKFAVEEGLDITVAPNEAGDAIVVELTNADEPEQTITRSWPMVDGDKAWSYTSKYALIRMFLIGDGEEADEADMANASSNRTRSTPATRPPATPATGNMASGETCPKCGVKSSVVPIPNAPPGGKVAICKRDNGGCGALLTAEEMAGQTALPVGGTA